jgi:membrane protein implicated in regulation of membrane protease activity
MKELLKNQYKNVILVCCYIIISTLVYTVSADCLWDIWWIDVIVGILIAVLGCYIGYKFIKSEEAERVKKLEAAEENKVVEEPIVEENTATENNEEEKVEENINEE